MAEQVAIFDLYGTLLEIDSSESGEEFWSAI